MSEHPQNAASPFSAAEVEVLHAEDRKAAAAIIGLMVAIFLIGISMYSVVCYVAMS